MPYFSSAGYDCYAISLRSQGASDPVQGLVAGTLDTHAADIADFVAGLRCAPVVVAHSFSGLILQKYILSMKDPKGSAGKFPDLAGAAFLCSVPPSGNKKLVGRVFMKDPIKSLKLTWGLVAKTFTTSVDACRELYFSPDIPRDDLIKYQNLLSQCSYIRLVDLQDVNAVVPLPPPPTWAPPVMVLGGDNDLLVDVPALEELAAYYNTKPIVLKNMAHDCMLDTRWKEAADALNNFLARLPTPAPTP